MAAASFKVEFPRRQAMLKVYETPEYPWQDLSAVSCRKEMCRVPVLVWPLPTYDGCFVVENQDGRCQKVWPYELTFLDGKELFDQYDWSEA